MNDLRGALFDLRVRVLTSIAKRQGIDAEESKVRALAAARSDRETIEQLRQLSGPLNWLRRLFQ